MSRNGKKRAKPTKTVDPSRKRRKIDVTPHKKLNEALSDVPLATFSANDLAWREVTPPERLDDAEGFLGLEEIDDVEVVQNAEGKQIRFRVCGSNSCSSLRSLTDNLG
jgi:ATP-dependent RNA helicase DDX24/MAK5